VQWKNVVKSQSVQSHFLERARQGQTPVVVYLLNGVRLEGRIDSFDAFALTLKGKTPHFVYKHAISTIVGA